MDERSRLLRQLQEDDKARRRDLPDLVFFMLATGVRIERRSPLCGPRSTSAAGRADHQHAGAS